MNKKVITARMSKDAGITGIQAEKAFTSLIGGIRTSLKKGKTELFSPFGKLMLSSSITLTPGTLTVDVNKDEFSIHCVRSTQSAEQIMALFEKFIKRITE